MSRSADDSPAKDPAPTWELLPYQPVEFFGLAPGFDRKDLKRSYNTLIRRFKPERFPDEFQKIRAAFEAVDDQLRYHTVDDEVDVAFGADDWSSGATSESTSDAAHVAAAEPDDILTRIRAASPESVYSELRDRANLTAQDYYQLAVLSDVVANKEPQDFVEWICRGLDSSRGDPRLIRLLYAHCHSGTEHADPRGLVTRLAASLSTSEFGYVTEKLWFQLIGQTEFAVVVNLLNECWRSIRDHDVGARFALVLRLTRRAVFVADEAWLREQMEFLWENYDEFATADDEFDLLDLLIDYRMEREEFRNGDPVRASIDQVLQDICALEESAADRAFLAWRVAHRSRGEDILKAVPYEDEHASNAIGVLQWYSVEVDDRLGEAGQFLDDKPRLSVVGKFLQRVDSLTDKSSRGCAMYASTLLGMIGLPLGLIGLAIWMGFVAEAWGIHYAVTLIAMLLGNAVFYWKVFLPHVALPFDDYMTKLCYLKIWRPEVLGFLNQEPVSCAEMVETILGDKKLSGFAIANEFSEHVMSDPGLAIVSLLRQRR